MKPCIAEGNGLPDFPTFGLPSVRRRITAVRLELHAPGIKGFKSVQPFAFYDVLFTKPASKGC